MEKHFVLLLAVMGLCLMFYATAETKANKRICVTIITIILTLFSGLRSWWFSDLIKYYTLYLKCTGAGGWSTVTEDFSNIGIRIFFFLSGNAGIPYDICIFLIAAFAAVTLGRFIYKYSPAPYWSYLVYIAMGFYLFTYSGLKQTIAMGFLLIAAEGIFENRMKKFLFWTLVAGVFHAPAFIFLPAYVVAKQRFTHGYFFLLALAVAVIFLFRDQLVGIVSQAYYEDETKYSTDGQIGGRTLMMIFILGVAAIMRPPREGDRIYCQTYNLMILAAMIQYFGMYNNVFSRLADYYYQFVVLFMPLMLERGTHQKRTNPKATYLIRSWNGEVYMLAELGVSLFAVWYYYSYLTGSAGMLNSFLFCWEIDPYSLYGS